MFKDVDFKVVRVLEGNIVAMNLENHTAIIRAFKKDVPAPTKVSFGLNIYTTFNSKSLDYLTESLATYYNDDYDIPVKWVKIGLNQDDELIKVERVKRSPWDDADDDDEYEELVWVEKIKKKKKEG